VRLLQQQVSRYCCRNIFILFIATPVLVDTISAADKELIEKQHKEG
jgi:DNA-directed RNA polymerase subunit N (RpoN/RPB10)